MGILRVKIRLSYSVPVVTRGVGTGARTCCWPNAKSFYRDNRTAPIGPCTEKPISCASPWAAKMDFSNLLVLFIPCMSAGTFAIGYADAAFLAFCRSARCAQIGSLLCRTIDTASGVVCVGDRRPSRTGRYRYQIWILVVQIYLPSLRQFGSISSRFCMR